MEAQSLLEQLPPPGEPITVAQLAKALGEDNSRVVRAIAVLHRRNLVERVKTGCYRLTPAGKEFRDNGMSVRKGPSGKHTARPKAKANMRDAIWRILRLDDPVTVNDILSLLPDHLVGSAPRQAAYNYLRMLRDSGHIIELPRREAGSAITSNGFKRWRLNPGVNSGPLTPYWSEKDQRIIDPNVVEADGHE